MLNFPRGIIMKITITYSRCDPLSLVAQQTNFFFALIHANMEIIQLMIITSKGLVLHGKCMASFDKAQIFSWRKNAQLYPETCGMDGPSRRM